MKLKTNCDATKKPLQNKHGIAISLKVKALRCPSGQARKPSIYQTL